MDAHDAATSAPSGDSAVGDRRDEIGPHVSQRSLPPMGSVAALIVPIALLLYLGLSNGGYGIEARSYVGALMWVVVAVACIAGVRPAASVSRSSAIVFVLLGIFAGWTALSLSWTENDERTAIELARVLAYFGVFAAATTLQSRGHVRELIAGTTIGLTALCAVALFSRMEPNLFPERVSGRFLEIPKIERRLAYPLNYSGGIAALVTMTVPPLLAHAWSARTVVMRVLAAAAIPMVLVTVWLTGSGLILAVSWAGVATFLLLTERRLRHILTLLAGILGGAILSFAVVQFEALDRGLTTPEALDDGDKLFALTIVVTVITGLIQFGLDRWSPPMSPAPRPSPARRAAAIGATAGGVLAVAAVLLLSGAADSAIDRFQSRENVPIEASRATQISDISSSGRYQQWQSAIDAGQSEPILGIGAGTFEFWWARNGLYGGYVRDAHSLYLETFAELGMVGLASLLAFIAAVLFAGIRRTLLADGAERRLRAGAVGLLAGFAAAAGVDWMWELGALPAAFMLIAAAACLPWGVETESEPAASSARDWALKVGLAVGAVVATCLIVVPALVESRIDQSQEEFRRGDLDAAYRSALSAQELAPYAATPRLQRAFVLERAGQIDEAVQAAEQAVERAPTDWRPALILSQMHAESGDAEAAAQAFEQARSLNPYSEVFAPPAAPPAA